MRSQHQQECAAFAQQGQRSVGKLSRERLVHERAGESEVQNQEDWKSCSASDGVCSNMRLPAADVAQARQPALFRPGDETLSVQPLDDVA